MSLPEAAPEPATQPLPWAEPRTIDTRSDLLRALEEACELEHALMVQYLFAAFSIRTRPGEGIDEREAEYGRRWKRRILHVAREEMMHLGLAANLLAAVGGRAWLRRTNLPAAHRYFPHAGEYLLFTLRPLSPETIERFVCFEQPEEPPLPTEEEPPEYRTVGELYRKVERFIEGSDPAQLFVGSPQRQEADTWKNPRWFMLEPVTDAASAVRAITRIVEEGEGTPSGTPESHYGRFVQIREELSRVRLEAVVKPVGPNPYLRSEPPSDDTATEITDPDTRSLAELFGRLYYSMLLLLELLYQFPAELAPVRGDLRDQLRRLMSGLLRPIGELLMDLPAGDGPPRAGPTFEIDEFIRLSDEPYSALSVVHERLLEDTATAQQLVPGPLAGRCELAGNVELLAGGIGLLPQPRVLMLRLLFSGWCQVRLATDPDPYDDRAGSSGRTIALATEPAFDRVIRFQRAVYPRLGAPTVGVDVDEVWDSERRLSDHPLQESSVDLLDNPVFEGRNGLVADDAYEPILPFVIEIARGPELRLRREDRPAAPWDPLSPDPAALGHRMGLGLEAGPDVAAEVGKAIGVDDPAEWRARRERVLRDARDDAQGAARLGLDMRLEMLEEIALVRVRYRFPVGRHGEVGEVHDAGRQLTEQIDTRHAWPIDLWLGGWDNDGLQAFVKGELRLPVVR